MSKKTTSKQDKANFLDYRNTNQVEKNKIKKLTRHCKNFPNDLKTKERLEEIQSKGGYKPRSKPLIPGSNKPSLSFASYWLPVQLKPVKTAGEQLSKLLGIPLIKTTRKKRKVRVKNVKVKKLSITV